MENFTKREAYFVDGHIIERLMQKEFGWREYSIVAAEELGNYQRYEVTTEKTHDHWDQETIDALPIEKQWSTRIYMSELAQRGIIPHGLYIIDTSW